MLDSLFPEVLSELTYSLRAERGGGERIPGWFQLCASGPNMLGVQGGGRSLRRG